MSSDDELVKTTGRAAGDVSHASVCELPPAHETKAPAAARAVTASSNTSTRCVAKDRFMTAGVFGFIRMRCRMKSNPASTCDTGPEAEQPYMRTMVSNAPGATPVEAPDSVPAK